MACCSENHSQEAAQVNLKPRFGEDRPGLPPPPLHRGRRQVTGGEYWLCWLRERQGLRVPRSDFGQFTCHGEWQRLRPARATPELPLGCIILSWRLATINANTLFEKRKLAMAASSVSDLFSGWGRSYRIALDTERKVLTLAVLQQARPSREAAQSKWQKKLSLLAKKIFLTPNLPFWGKSVSTNIHAHPYSVENGVLGDPATLPSIYGRYYN